MLIHLEELEKIQKVKNDRYLFPCIKDLVINGIIEERFSSDDVKSSRQDITQFLASWIRYVGISSDECEGWMIKYCVDVLSVLSKSSTSRIKHSTKSNIKYIYRSEVPFECRCENNPFKAACDKSCHIYERMAKKNKEKEEREAEYRESLEIKHKIEETESVAKPISDKEKYKEQFEKALEMIEHYLSLGVKRWKIVSLLDEGGFKTRSGKKWTDSILSNEIV